MTTEIIERLERRRQEIRSALPELPLVNEVREQFARDGSALVAAWEAARSQPAEVWQAVEKRVRAAGSDLEVRTLDTLKQMASAETELEEIEARIAQLTEQAEAEAREARHRAEMAGTLPVSSSFGPAPALASPAEVRKRSPWER